MATDQQACAECGAPVVQISDPRQPELVAYVCQRDWAHEWEDEG